MIPAQYVIVIKVRRKADAKGGKEASGGFASSDAVCIIITWGTYEDSKGKEKTGITACDFSLTEPVGNGEE